MTIAKLVSAPAADVAGSSFEEQIHSAAAPSVSTRAASRRAVAHFESGPAWHETLQAAARLKLVVGPNRRVVTVTGVEPGDGATSLAARLGAAMAQIDHAPVLIVEGNVASPRLAQLFGLTPGPGFLDVLEQRADLQQAIRPVVPPNLFVLPLGEGEAAGSLASLLTSASGAFVMSAIREQFRYVIVDAGLIRRQAEGMLLASLADGVVVAVAIAVRRRDEIAGFHEELQRLKIPLFGVVLTRVA